MELNLWLILFQGIIFLTALVVLHKIVYKNVLVYLAERERNIDGFVRDARILADEADAKENQLLDRLTQARVKAGEEQVKIIGAARDEENSVIATANANAQRTIDEATQKIAEDSATAQKILDGEADDLARKVTAAVLGRTLAVFVALTVAAGPALAESGAATHGPPWKWLILHGINLILLIAVLTKFLKRPLADFLANRKATIADDLERARQVSDEARSRAANIDERMEHIDEEVNAIVVRTVEVARSDAESRLARAKQVAATIEEAAQLAIADEQARATQRIRVAIAERALHLAKAKVSQEVSDADEQRLYRETLDGIGGAQ